MLSIRQSTAKHLLELACLDSCVVAMTADLSSSVGFDLFKQELPAQYIQCGIAEQEMLSMAAGLALAGQKPFAGSFAAFHPGRNWDQLRTSVCYNQAPVRLISSHYGLSVGGDGATHQCLEYLAITLCLPNLKILLPFNNPSAEWVIDRAYATDDLPTVIFQPRDVHPEYMDEIAIDAVERYGYAYLRESDQPTTLFITGGLISYETVSAMRILNQTKSGVDTCILVDLTGLDINQLASIISFYQRVVIVEEHQSFGGLGSLVFDIMLQNQVWKPIQHVAMEHQFGKSGLKTADLWRKYRLDAPSIVSKVNSFDEVGVKTQVK